MSITFDNGSSYFIFNVFLLICLIYMNFNNCTTFKVNLIRSWFFVFFFYFFVLSYSSIIYSFFFGLLRLIYDIHHLEKEIFSFSFFLNNNLLSHYESVSQMSHLALLFNFPPVFIFFIFYFFSSSNRFMFSQKTNLHRYVITSPQNEYHIYFRLKGSRSSLNTIQPQSIC